MGTAFDKQLPRTKLDLVYGIRDLIGISQRGILEVYEFEQMRKPSLIALYQALKAGTSQLRNGSASEPVVHFERN